MSFNIQKQSYKIAILALLSAFLLLLAFKIGELVGFRKAAFSYRWGAQYHQNFGGPRAGFFGEDDGRGFMNAHGSFGTILKIDGNTVLVRDADNTEKTIIVGDKTVINRMNGVIGVSDLAVDERVTIIGTPNDKGQIDAKFIRAFPSSPPPPPSFQPFPHQQPPLMNDRNEQATSIPPTK
jgi:hypothetical protein